MANSEEQLRRLAVDLNVNVATSKMIKCSRDEMAGRMNVNINGEILKEVSGFKCLKSHVMTDGIWQRK